MLQLWNCILGPKLYRIYAVGQQINEGQNSVFSPNGCEKFGNNIIKVINIFWNVGIYASPLIVTYLYRKDYFCIAGCLSIGKFITGISLLLVFGMIIRGMGRFVNPSYTEFLGVLLKATNNSSIANKKLLSNYDFEFWAWPTDFSVKSVEGDNSKVFTQVERSASEGKVGPLWWALGLPCNLAAFCCMHLFGRHLIYPGSIQLLQAVMESLLIEGREKLFRNHKGTRNKVLTRDGNDIDTMFVDRRRSKEHLYGSTLVVCCEGNASFYEVGLMQTPLDAGYSVLGWNHPGFAGSTGLPFPSQEQQAVDSVMQLAIHRLGFMPEEIIVFAWSIGGYAGTWAAMNYPQIRGLVVDATFDDLLPLALPKMPVWMGGVVTVAVRRHMNLNVSDQLCQYPGPTTIIRRTQDEIISVIEGDLSTNRGNHLLMKLLRCRYPNLYDSAQVAETIRQWLAEEQKMQDAIYNSWSVDDESSVTQLVAYIDEHGESNPLRIGDGLSADQKTAMMLFIARRILVNFNSSHNNPLESRLFKVPWTPITDPTFVQL